MTSIAKLNDVPMPALIALAILGFFLWWPLGLAILACIIWSGRMGCCGFSLWNDRSARALPVHDGWRLPRTSGNRSFDDYRAETLQRLEQEQRDFQDFLVRLRLAKDKAEFDQFMAERRTRPDSPPQSQT